MSLRSNAARWLLGHEYKRLQESIGLLLDAQMDVRQWAVSPQALIQRLEEVDSELVDLMIRQRGYVPIVGQAFNSKLLFTEQDRIRAVYQSRYMAHFDVMTGRAVGMWTDFGFGQRVSVRPRDEQARVVWDAFWDSPQNQYILADAEIHVLSNDEVKDGEQFFIFFISTIDGAVTIRRMATDDVTEIKYHVDDKDVPLRYVRNTEQGAIYYDDWRATEEQLDTCPIPQGAKSANELRPRTKVVVLHAAFDKIDGRGWPLLRRALEWARAYKDFLGDRATVAKAVAMYIDKLKVDGGSRAVSDVIQRLQSSLVNGNDQFLDRNPPPATGSTWVENGAIERSRLPMGTGAGDAQTDGMTLAAQFATGAGMPLHWLGRTDAAQNRSVARESSLPAYAQINRYQNFWSDVFGYWVEIVLRAAEKYGNAKFTTYEADITLDTPLDADIAEVNAVMASVLTANQSGRIPDAVADKAIMALAKTALSSLGVRNVDEVLKPPAAETPITDPAAPVAPVAITTSPTAAPEKSQEVAPVVSPTGEDVKVQDTALNGAQVASLLDIVAQVQAGVIPADVARALIKSAFPSMTDERIDEILNPLKGSKAAVSPAPPAIRAAMEKWRTGELTNEALLAELVEIAK